MIIGIDPGYTTGVVIADSIKDANTFNVTCVLDVKWEERLAIFSSLFKSNAKHIEAIVIERFKLFPHENSLQAQIGSEIPSARVIGLVECECYRYKLLNKLVVQETWQRNQVKILPVHYDLVGNSKHTRDAYRHIRYYVKMRQAHV